MFHNPFQSPSILSIHGSVWHFVTRQYYHKTEDANDAIYIESQTIAEVCFQMIADDRRTFCDLRSAIRDRLRSYGNQPLALAQKQPSPFVCNLDKECNFGISGFCDDKPPFYGLEALHYDSVPTVMDSTTSLKYKYCCYVWLNFRTAPYLIMH